MYNKSACADQRVVAIGAVLVFT